MIAGQFFKLSSPLSEAKYSVTQLRRWIESGINPTEIALLAPAISNYQIYLKPLLEQEGIPFQSVQVSALKNYVSIAQLLSNLKINAREFSYFDIETSFYSSEQAPLQKFEVCHSQTYFLEETSDFERSLKKLKMPFSPAEKNPRLNFLEFQNRVFDQAADIQLKAFGDSLIRFQQTVDVHALLPLESWIRLLEKFLGQTKISSENEILEQGVRLISLLDHCPGNITHKIYLGLSESSFKAPQLMALSTQEIEKLNADLGVFLSHPDQNPLDYQLQAHALSPSAQQVFLTSEYDFQSDPDSPHPFWTENSLQKSNSEPLEVQTVFDDHLSNAKVPESLSKPNLLNSAAVEFLSPSGFERFKKCGFVYFAERKLKLDDLPYLDLELDHRTKGSFLHALVEDLIHQLEITDPELEKLIEEKKRQLNFEFLEESLWTGSLVKYKTKARRFIENEIQKKIKFPGVKTLFQEKAFSFPLELPSGIVTLRGKIDRMDIDEKGRVILYDYKSSVSSKMSFTQWFKQNQLQLLFYALAAAKGHISKNPDQKTDQKPFEIGGAFFYSLKDFSSRWGFALDQTQGTSLAADQVQSFLSTQEIEKLMEQFENVLKTGLEQMIAGIFKPQPHNPDECANCKWNQLCRAPHLKT